MASSPLEDIFPNLKGTAYTIASPANTEYNCIAWSVGDTEQWWWPSPLYYWPPGVPREETVEAFVRGYGTLGFVPCKDDSLEPGFEKIAIYVEQGRKPTHAARQLSNGQWTSKLGKSEDIEHALHGLENSPYGSVVLILKRPVRR